MTCSDETEQVIRQKCLILPSHSSWNQYTFNIAHIHWFGSMALTTSFQTACFIALVFLSSVNKGTHSIVLVRSLCQIKNSQYCWCLLNRSVVAATCSLVHQSKSQVCHYSVVGSTIICDLQNLHISTGLAIFS